MDPTSASRPRAPAEPPQVRRMRARAGGSKVGIAKALTGIEGLDEITRGGLPRGRPTLVCGGAGCGKTLLALEFLMRGAVQFDEPGVLITFEESPDEIATNVASLGFDLEAMIAERRLAIDHVRIDRAEIEEAGEYDLEGLFIRIQLAIDEVGAKRIVLDTIESLFSSFTDEAVLRAELRRLFRFLKDRGLTAVITGERGEGQLTRQGLEEYVSDCVIFLDHRTVEQQSIRRLRIVKYRGTAHGTNEYPFIIGEDGFSVLPITSLGLDHAVSSEIVSFGVADIDRMLGSGGVYRGSTVLVSGVAGTGKTSLGAAFIDATCRRGERGLLVSYEESEAQIVRNMQSIGLDLRPWIADGRLHIHSTRPSTHGLEAHLLLFHDLVSKLAPQAVVIDPISSLLSVGSRGEARTVLVRLIDFLKSHGVTALYTDLTPGDARMESTEIGISSLIDTWFLLRQIEVGGERNRTLFLLKSRGMGHSNQVRELLLSERGIELREAYLGRDGVLTGSARLLQEARDRDERVRAEEERRRASEQLDAKSRALEAQIAALEADLGATRRRLQEASLETERAERLHEEDARALARSRHADGHSSSRDVESRS